MSNNKARIAVLVSGGGTNLQALLDAQRDGIIKSGEIVLVISSKPGAYALERAAKAGVRGEVANRRELGTQDKFEQRILDLLEQNDIDLIILAGFMSILSEDFVSRYPRRIINVHPSLIPALCGEGYYGLRVHEAALEYGVKVTSGEIIFQKAVKVNKGDTPEILQRRVMERAEWILLPRAAEKVSKEIIKTR